jgi:L-aminopeptidase/D-esterase-like protein
MNNLITDVAGLLVGNAEDARVKSGVTVVLCEQPAVASVHVMGGAPGTRETDLLAPEQSVQAVDAVVLSGGSAFGLAAADGVHSALAAMGRGVAIGPARVPIVPAAILFDLLNGDDKNWGEASPYKALGQTALANAARAFALGTVGAGAGATTANLKGGLGSASARLSGGGMVAALVAVNAVGQATVGETAHFWAAPFEVGSEFGALGYPRVSPAAATVLRHKGQAQPMENTTIAVVATDVKLTKAEAKRLAVMAHDGFARALWPSHTPIDGDLIFSLSTGRSDAPVDLIELGATAAAVMARAIARGVYEAHAAPGDVVPAWRDRFSGHGQSAVGDHRHKSPGVL